MARMISRAIQIALAALIVGACQSAPARSKSTDLQGIEIVSVSRQSPYNVNIYIDYPGKYIATEVSTDFWRMWSEGGWGARVQLRDRDRVTSLENALEHAPVSRKLSDEDRLRFLERVRMVIESEREPGEIYYVDGCNFIKKSGAELFVAASEIRSYYANFDLFPSCQ